MSQSKSQTSLPLSNTATAATAAPDEAATPATAHGAALAPEPQRQPDTIVPVAAVFPPEVMIAIVSALQGVPHIVSALQALTQAVQQVLPQVQAALVVSQQPAATPAATPATEAKREEKEADEDNDAWKPRYINMPPPPPRQGGPNPFNLSGIRNFSRMHRVIQKGSWDDIEQEYRRASGGVAMPEEVRARIARIRKELGLSGPPSVEVSWPLPETGRAVPFTLTPEMLLAPLRADLVRQGKAVVEPLAESSDENADGSEAPKEGTAEGQPKGRRKPPSDMN